MATEMGVIWRWPQRWANRDKSRALIQKWEKWRPWRPVYFLRDTSLKIGTVPEHPGWMVTFG